jgi:parallel beta-helix repeat protein
MLKKLLYLFSLMGLILPLTVQSATYYFSSSSGNDANDGTSESSPWQTLDKFKEIVFEDNSTFLFKRGDIFRGTIQLKRSPKNLSFGAYGSGENPVIAGSVQITGWTPTKHAALERNVYEADVSSFIQKDEEGNENTIEQLFVNGKLMTIARYPNVDSPAEKNWLQVGAGVGENAFTDPDLAAYGKADGYWKGATLRLRNYSWTYMIREIKNYRKNNGQITVTDLGGQLPEWGYFLDGKLEELDHPGEWYYDAKTKKIYLYPPTSGDPNTLLIEGSTYAIGLSIGNEKDQAVVENLTFRHTTEMGAKISGVSNVILRNCHFEHNVTGLTVWNSPDVLIQNNTFDYQFDTAILLLAGNGFDVKNSVIEKNKITNSGMYPAYGVRYDGIYQGKGIMVFGKAYIVRQNTIENTGHAGITLKDAGHHIIENNVIRQSLLLLNDGGALTISSDGNVIRGNILLESFGNVDESNGCANLKKSPCSHHYSYGMGIGADNTFKNNVIEGNTVANNQNQGIRLNSFINTTVSDNVVYNNNHNQLVIEDVYGSKTSRNNVISNNIIYSLDPEQYNMTLTNDTRHGTFQNNTYCNPYSEVLLIKDRKRYSFGHWQKAFSSLDKNSKWCGLRFDEYEASNIGENLFANSTFEEDDSNWSGTTFNKSTNKWNKAISVDTSQSQMDGGSLKLVLKNQEAKVISQAVNLAEKQWYRLRFSVVGNGFGSIKLRVNHAEPGNINILYERYFAYDETRKEYNWFFESPMTTEFGKLIFQTQEQHDAKTYWLDNIYLEPVQATKIDPKEKSVLFINETDQTKNIDLKGATYEDLKGKKVTGNLRLQPFSSQILIYISGGTTTPEPSIPPSPFSPAIRVLDNATNGQIVNGVLYTLNSNGVLDFYINGKRESSSLDDLGTGMPASGFSSEITGLLYTIQGNPSIPAGSFIVTESSGQVHWWKPDGSGWQMNESKPVNALFSLYVNNAEEILYSLEGNNLMPFYLPGTGGELSDPPPLPLSDIDFPSDEAVKIISRDNEGKLYYLVTQSNEVYVLDLQSSQWYKQQ